VHEKPAASKEGRGGSTGKRKIEEEEGRRRRSETTVNGTRETRESKGTQDEVGGR
jgi:hypothetical protein